VLEMATLLIALGFFVLLAVLGPLVGADSRVSRGVDPDRIGRQALARSAVNGPVSSAPAPDLEVWPCGG
jgi:hypothetical protein